MMLDHPANVPFMDSANFVAERAAESSAIAGGNATKMTDPPGPAIVIIDLIDLGSGAR